MEPFADAVLEVVAHTWHVLAEAAPWLLFGLFAAGLVKWALPERRLVKLMGRSSMTQVLRAAFIGAPLPLCSCGVLPAALGLRREGLTKAGTSSFLVATPQNGVDSVALSYALLGPVFTVVRVLTSLVSAVAAGAATLLLDRAADAPSPRRATSAEPNPTAKPATTASCGCSSNDGLASATPKTPATSAPVALGVETPAQGTSCCSSSATPAAQPAAASTQASCCSSAAADAPTAPRQTFLSGQKYAFGRFLLDIGGWLAVGLIIAGAMNAFVGPGGLAEFGSGFLAMIAVLLISIPMYICASASTPVAASMLIAGVSPGVVLVFLLAGPATNFAGVALIKRDLGLRATVGYLGGLIISVLALGLLADFFMLSLMDWTPAPMGEAGGHLLPPWVGAAAGFFILALYAGLHVAEFVKTRRSDRRDTPERDRGAGDDVQPRTHAHAHA